MRRLALLACVLPLAACGGGSSSNSSASSQGATMSPAAYVKSAATKTSQATSERATFRATATVAGQAVTLKGGGLFDNAKRVGTMHAEFSAGGFTGEIDEILNGTTIYMRSPLFAASLPQGKTWVKLDLQKFGQSKGIDFSALLSQNPAQSFAQLRASRQVTEVGEETINGADTIHYRGRIDVAKLPQAQNILALTHAKYAPYDVWVGKDDGYVHRMKTAYSLSTPGAGRQSVAMTIDFSDFGTDVSVVIPDESETFDATNLSIKGFGK